MLMITIMRRITSMSMTMIYNNDKGIDIDVHIDTNIDIDTDTDSDTGKDNDDGISIIWLYCC